MMSPLMVLALFLSPARALMYNPFGMSTFTRPRSTPEASTPVDRAAASTTRIPFHHVALPAATYAGLAAVTAGSVKVMGAAMTSAAWAPYALMGWCVGAPITILTAQLAKSGGAGIAKDMGGVPADSYLTGLAHDAARALDVTPPENVYEIDRSEPNAFAASGFGSKGTTVAITSGLRKALTSTELSAVLAHEMGHLRHRDVARNMHVAIASAGLGGVYEAGRMILESSRRSKKKSKGKDKEEDEGGAVMTGLALMGVGMGSQAIAHGVKLAVSRDAELRADLAAADAFGANALISALKKIDAAAAKAPADLRSSAEGRKMAFAMISDGPSQQAPSSRTPSTSESSWSSQLGRAWRRASRLVRTHPPIEERIAALTRAAESGAVPWTRDTWW